MPQISTKEQMLFIMQEKNWSQAGLADALGMHPATIGRWMKDLYSARPSKKLALQRLYEQVFDEAIKNSKNPRHPASLNIAGENGVARSLARIENLLSFVVRKEVHNYGADGEYDDLLKECGLVDMCLNAEE